MHQAIGRNRALDVLLISDNIRAAQADAYGQVNRALPDAELDTFVDVLATRISGFGTRALGQTKRLASTSLPAPGDRQPRAAMAMIWRAVWESPGGRPAGTSG